MVSLRNTSGACSAVQSHYAAGRCDERASPLASPTWTLSAVHPASRRSAFGYESSRHVTVDMASLEAWHATLQHSTIQRRSELSSKRGLQFYVPWITRQHGQLY